MTRYELLKLITISVISFLPFFFLTRKLLYYGDLYYFPGIYTPISQIPFLCHFLIEGYHTLVLIVAGCAFAHSLRHLVSSDILNDPLTSNLVGIALAYLLYLGALLISPQVYLACFSPRNISFLLKLLKVTTLAALYEVTIKMMVFTLVCFLFKRSKE